METHSRARVLVTGANGFVGTALAAALSKRGMPARLAVRDERAALRLARGPGEADVVAVGDVGAATDWRAALKGVDAVVHLAARSHVMREHAADPLAAYRAVNVEGTRRLARDAEAAGVRRLVFVSSVKVNGERTGERAFTEEDPPAPEDAYGISKWEAEQALWDAAGKGGTGAVVLRPPLMYGPGVKGNFLSLVRAVARGTPLPLASVDNRRSLLFVGNLVDAVLLCIDHPAAGGTYLLADGPDVSTPELARGIGEALGRRARLLHVPPALLRLAGAASGRSPAVSRLLGSLRVDSARIRRELGWRPGATLAQGLAETARWYHEYADSREAP